MSSSTPRSSASTRRVASTVVPACAADHMRCRYAPASAGVGMAREQLLELIDDEQPVHPGELGQCGREAVHWRIPWARDRRPDPTGRELRNHAGPGQRRLAHAGRADQEHARGQLADSERVEARDHLVRLIL